jgi:thiamine kinase-like enzyme
MNPSAGVDRRLADELVLERAFTALPMLGAIARWRITPFEGGFANRSWLLAAADAKLVLRVPVHDTRALGVDRTGERIAIGAAAAMQLAPRLIYFEVTTGLMLSEYVEGHLWSRADAHDARCVARLAERLQVLHTLALPAGARQLDFAELVASYRASLAARNGARSQERSVLEPQADRRLAELALHPRKRALCHNDVHHRNIIDGPALKLVEWEYAAVGDGMFDLASFACYHDLNAAERMHLIESYAPLEAAVLAQSFDNYCWLFDYMHLLWLELSASDAAACGRLMQRLAGSGA